MAEWKVPLFDLEITEEEYQCVKSVLDSKWLTMGQVTKDFERAFAKYLGVKHAIAVNSGTAALHLACHAMGLGPGEEVICPSLSFVATANAILYTGARPVFADITSADDLTISPDDVEARIGDRTKGIVAVHYAGFPCDMDKIMAIARSYKLFVIEDCAHAPGAEYRSSAQGSRLKPHGASRDDRPRTMDHAARTPVNGERSMVDGLNRKVGTIGDIGCFSFFGNKNMTTAEGGMVVTNRDDLAEKVIIARSHGMTSLTWDRYKGHGFSYDVVDLGYNYRIDELRSSLGLVQLRRLDRNNGRRRELWKSYVEKLEDVEEIKIPFSYSRGSSSCHIFPVLLSHKVERKGFMLYLRERGIQTSIHYRPIHLFSYYKNLMLSQTRLPLTGDVASREVTVPLYPTMQKEHLEYVVNFIKDYLAG